MPPDTTPRSSSGQTKRSQVVESPILRRLIHDRAAELFADGDGREISAVIAREFGITEARVDHIIAGLMLEHQRRADTLAVAVRNGISQAGEAGAAVWRDGWGRPIQRAGVARAAAARVA